MARWSCFTTALLAGLVLSASSAAQGWPEIFDPLVLRTLNLEMSDADWHTIQSDESFEIEVPTLLWLDGEAPILVSIRRKSADPLTAAPGFDKVSYKIDINELVSGQNWHGLRAVSLDNGDDQDVVSEGLAWYLHRVSAGVYGYDPGLASWVRLVINGVDTGVYVNAEQRDKRFLENRGLWIEDETWLYEVEDLQGFELDEGEGDSPTFQTLCYAPFASPAFCPTPDAATLAAQLPALVDMQGLLSLAAVDTFSGNPDGIFSHAKNFYFADYLNGQRLHFPWDLDSALGGGGLGGSIYAEQSAYSDILLSVPSFRAQYSQIMNELVCGPLAVAPLHGFLDALEPVLAEALAADPNSQIDGSVAEFFEGRKAWIAQRVAGVSGQIEGFVPCGAGDPWTDLGGGTAGIQGTPALEGTGPLTAGSTMTLGLTGGPPSAPALLWIATAPVPFAFLGGTVHALPYVAQVLLVTSPAGSFGGSTTWPALPAGTQITFQILCQDAAALGGISLSNGLRGTVP